MVRHYSKRARGTRSTTDVPRLTADRRRTKTLNRGRWRVVALEWGGEGGGEGTIGRLTWRYGVGDARGTPWTLGTDGNTPGGNIYRVSRFDARGETEEVFFAIFFFFFLQKSCSRVLLGGLFRVVDVESLILIE